MSTETTEQPLVTICVPTYNDVPHLRDSLNSIVGQTYDRLEILVGDDGSTDNTEELVESFADHRICYTRNERNLGQFPNVNKLIRLARGKYVAIYHSDDIYHPEIIAKEVDFLEEHPEVAAVFALDWRIDSDGNVTGEMKLYPEIPVRAGFRLDDIMPFLLRHKNRLFRGPTFMGRAEIFDRVGLFKSEYDIAGDFEFWVRVMTKFRVAILDEPLMYYRRGSTQVSTNYQRLRTFEEHYFTIMDHYLDEEGLLESIDEDSRTEYAFHRCDDETFRAANYVLQGQTTAARELLRRSFPWRTLTVSTDDIHWRKARVLLLRAVMRCGLALSLNHELAHLLAWTEYRGSL